LLKNAADESAHPTPGLVNRAQARTALPPRTSQRKCWNKTALCARERASNRARRERAPRASNYTGPARVPDKSFIMGTGVREGGHGTRSGIWSATRGRIRIHRTETPCRRLQDSAAMVLSDVRANAISLVARLRLGEVTQRFDESPARREPPR